MTVVWFFMILTWNGQVVVPKIYSSLEACRPQQEIAIQQYGKHVRSISVCIGLPIEENIR